MSNEPTLGQKWQTAIEQRVEEAKQLEETAKQEWYASVVRGIPQLVEYAISQGMYSVEFPLPVVGMREDCLVWQALTAFCAAHELVATIGVASRLCVKPKASK